jgi:glutaredoxin 3
LVDVDPVRREEMMTRTGRRTVPQIFIGETHVGGFDDLSALDKAGKLDPLLGK